MKTFSRAMVAVVLTVLCILGFAGAAHAQDPDLAVVVDAIEQNGRYLERDVDAAALEAIDRANADGIAFVRLDTNAQVPTFASAVSAELDARNSQYGAVLVLTNSGIWSRGVPEASAAGDAVTPLFGAGQIGDGIDQFTALLGGAARGGSSTTGSESTSSGGGFPWIIPIILIIGGFFLFNMLRGRKKTRAASAKAIEDDRAEIIEQLKANADRVIDLGDEVIKAKDPELISIYEEASATYQNVSNEIRNATTAAEVDALDDQIDKAEWQFEVLEAKLTGQTPPPFLDTDAPPPPTPSAGPPSTPPPPGPVSAAERDEQFRRQGQNPRPLPRRNPRVPTRSQRGRGMGGMLGKMALSVLMSMLMGGRLGSPNTSRRSSRRSGGGYGGIRSPF
ncbi:MAG: hypothetical protein HKN03_02870 [Acidimicrobiales bacterium]|nr:hypothetical protein [Acidimicrobiales bacterium]